MDFLEELEESSTRKKSTRTQNKDDWDDDLDDVLDDLTNFKKTDISQEKDRYKQSERFVEEVKKVPSTEWKFDKPPKSPPMKEPYDKRKHDLEDSQDIDSLIDDLMGEEKKPKKNKDSSLEKSGFGKKTQSMKLVIPENKEKIEPSPMLSASSQRGKNQDLYNFGSSDRESSRGRKKTDLEMTDEFQRQKRELFPTRKTPGRHDSSSTLNENDMGVRDIRTADSNTSAGRVRTPDISSLPKSSQETKPPRARTNLPTSSATIAFGMNVIPSKKMAVTDGMKGFKPESQPEDDDLLDNPFSRRRKMMKPSTADNEPRSRPQTSGSGMGDMPDYRKKQTAAVLPSSSMERVPKKFQTDTPKKKKDKMKKNEDDFEDFGDVGDLMPMETSKRSNSRISEYGMDLEKDEEQSAYDPTEPREKRRRIINKKGETPKFPSSRPRTGDVKGSSELLTNSFGRPPASGEVKSKPISPLKPVKNIEPKNPNYGGFLNAEFDHMKTDFVPKPDQAQSRQETNIETKETVPSSTIAALRHREKLLPPQIEENTSSGKDMFKSSFLPTVPEFAHDKSGYGDSGHQDYKPNEALNLSNVSGIELKPSMNRHELQTANKGITELKEKLDLAKNEYNKVLGENHELHETIKTLRKELGDEKEKSEKIEETTKNKFMAEKDDLQKKFQDDIQQLKKVHSEAVELSFKEKERLISDLEKRMEMEREKLQMLHKMEIENLQKQHALQMENQKAILERESQTLQKQMQQQIEMAKISSQMEDYSKKLGGFITNYQEQASYTVEEEKKKIEEKKTELLILENKLEFEKNKIEKESEMLEQRRKGLNTKEVEIEQEMREEKRKYEEKYNQLVLIQKQNEDNERKKREDIAMEKKKLENEKETFEQNVKIWEDDYNQKVQEINLKIQIFNKTKEDHNNLEEQYNRNYQAKRADLENKRKQIASEESDLRKRKQILAENENQVKRESDDLQLKIEEYQFNKYKFDIESKKIQEMGLKIQEESEVISKFKSNFEREKEEIQRTALQLQTERQFIMAEKARLNEFRSELDIRQKTLASLRFEYLQEPRPQVISQNISPNIPLNKIPSPFKTMPEEMKHNQPGKKIGATFNANTYLSQLQRDLDKNDVSVTKYLVEEKNNLLLSKQNMGKAFGESLIGSVFPKGERQAMNEGNAISNDSLLRGGYSFPFNNDIESHEIKQKSQLEMDRPPIALGDLQKSQVKGSQHSSLDFEGSRQFYKEGREQNIGNQVPNSAGTFGHLKTEEDVEKSFSTDKENEDEF